MSTELKQLAARWFEEVWNKRKRETIRELMDESAIGISEAGPILGPQDFDEKVFAALTNAFPDLHAEIEGIIAEGDEVVVRSTIAATHSGPLMHLPPTGRRFSLSGMTWLKFRGGKIVEGGDRFNLHALIGYLSSGAETATVRAV